MHTYKCVCVLEVYKVYIYINRSVSRGLYEAYLFVGIVVRFNIVCISL